MWSPTGTPRPIAVPAPAGSSPISNTNGLQYVQIDLGATFPVNKVSVWHYNGDGRTYHNTKTQVSADGSNWTTVFDSATSGRVCRDAGGQDAHLHPAERALRPRLPERQSTANSRQPLGGDRGVGHTTTTYPSTSLRASIGDYYEWNGSAQTMTRLLRCRGRACGGAQQQRQRARTGWCISRRPPGIDINHRRPAGRGQA